MNFKDYIQGKRNGKEANQLERDAMNDPFLQDALDGFSGFEGDHVAVINSLENNFNKKSVKKQFKLKYWIVGVAASVCLVVGVGSLYLLNNDEQKHFSQNSIQKTKKSVVESKPVIPSLIEESINDNQLKTKHTQKPNPIQDIKNAIVVEESLVHESVQDVSSNVNSMDDSKIEDYIIQEEKITEIAQTSIPKSSSQKSNNIISGKIVDEKGEAIIGVSVKLKDANSETITDLNGNFSLNVNNIKSKTIVASYIGYTKKEVPIADGNIIQLEPDNIALNEVVVVGYGSQKRSSITGAVSSVRKESSSYGEKDFVKYVKENHKQKICFQKNEFIQVKFTTDQTGKPINLEIIDSTCSQLEVEFIQLFKNSPSWTDKLKKVELKIQF